MDLHTAEQLTLTLMNEHVMDKSWTFRWGRGKRMCGCVKSKTRTLELSKTYVQLNGEEQVRNTILHEIAHIRAGLQHGHNHVWRTECVRIGAKPIRLNHTATMPTGKHKVICGCCNDTLVTYHRKPKPGRFDRTYCRKCGRQSLGKLFIIQEQG